MESYDFMNQESNCMSFREWASLVQSLSQSFVRMKNAHLEHTGTYKTVKAELDNLINKLSMSLREGEPDVSDKELNEMWKRCRMNRKEVLNDISTLYYEDASNGIEKALYRLYVNSNEYKGK